MNDLDLCRAAAATYQGPATWETKFLDCHAYLTSVDNVAVVAFKGSVSLMDWVRDFMALPIHRRISVGNLGWVHAGFFGDVNGIWQRIKVDLGNQPFAVTGHSKGGAEAIIFAAMMLEAGRMPVRVATFGAPRAGMGTLRDVLAAVPVAQYRHARDVVPEVPFGDEWCHARPLVELDTPVTVDRFADHHIPFYLSGMQAYQEALNAAGSQAGG